MALIPCWLVRRQCLHGGSTLVLYKHNTNMQSKSSREVVGLPSCMLPPLSRFMCTNGTSNDSVCWISLILHTMCLCRLAHLDTFTKTSQQSCAQMFQNVQSIYSDCSCEVLGRNLRLVEQMRTHFVGVPRRYHQPGPFSERPNLCLGISACSKPQGFCP